MPANGIEERSGREVTLLVFVIAVAVGCLLVLARFRFPAAEIAAVSTPPPSPLDRLVTRASFDDLSSVMADLAARITPTVLSIGLDPAPPPEKPSHRPAAGVAATPPAARRWVAALRVQADLAVAYVPADLRVAALVGMSIPPEIAASDPKRGLVLARVPSSETVTDFATAMPNFTGGGYAVAVEGAMGGPSVRPVYIPRADVVPDGLWTPSPLQIGGDAALLTPGALIFSLGGRFVGIVVPHDAGLAIVPAAALERAAADLAGGGSRTPR
jgi:hypothetical protein